MRCVVGIDLGSTTTKAVLLDDTGALLGRGITNSRSNYTTACAVAREEAHVATRFELLRRGLATEAGFGLLLPSVAERREEPERRVQGIADSRASDTVLASSGRAPTSDLLEEIHEAFRLETYLAELTELRRQIEALVDAPLRQASDAALSGAAASTLRLVAEAAPALFGPGRARRSDFFRDLAAEAFMVAAERVSAETGVSFERLVGLFDRAILAVETRLCTHDFGERLTCAVDRVVASSSAAKSAREGARVDALRRLAQRCAAETLEEVAMAGTGYGRQTLPFPKEAVRSEILCHGRGAHHVFPGTRTVLDIGGQDTKAIQVDDAGLVSSFQMNDRCAAGCGRYLGYIADELNLGLHELGPLALGSRRAVKVNSTCTVFAGAELRERLALGERRDDILAGLHRSIMLRAMSLLARSGGVRSELTFTGGVCKNPMATKVLRELVDENYGQDVVLNLSAESIYMGALGAALFAVDDVRAGRPTVLPSFALQRPGLGRPPIDPGAPEGVTTELGGESCSH